VSVSQRPNGHWRAEVYHEGRRVAYNTFPSKELARAWYENQRSSLHKGEAGIRERKAAPTLREVATRFLKSIEPSAAAGTLRYYNQRLAKSIVPNLGHKPITALSRADVANYLTARRRSGMKAASHGKELQIVKRLFNWAIEQEWIDSSPIVGLKAEKAPKTIEPRFYTAAEVDTMLGKLSGNAYGLVLTGFRTGMRHRELLTFDFSWCDFRQRTVTIPNSVRFTSKGKKQRTVPMPADLEAWLRARPNRAGRVFISEKTRAPLRSFRHQLEIVETLTSVPLRLHDCRHTYASFLIAAGVPLTEVQAALGHSTITTTMIYAHLSPSYLSHIREALGRAARGSTRPLRLVK
jgi:site-specific recombinase XerD